MKQLISELNYQEIWGKLKLILAPDFSFFVVSIIYGVGVSILTLAIPISVQSLVNTVAFGVLYQPLLVLSLVLLSLLLFSGVLNALQTYIIEVFQRHFFTRTTSDIAIKLLNSDVKSLEKTNGVELVNRYFDVMTVQKTATTLLTGGVSIILQTVVGLILLAFYHPYFLIFDVLLITVLWAVWAVFGKTALVTSSAESKAKYKMASWLEEIARSNLFFKTTLRKKEALNQSNNLIENYLKKREAHFRRVFSQTILLLAIYALMSSLILGLGGFLVIQGQLTLGQLVAAELVVTVILSGFSKGGKYLESFYDLYAAVDKLSQFHEISLLEGPSIEQPVHEGYELKFEKTFTKTDNYEFHFDMVFEEGKNYLIHSQFFSIKLVFLDLIQGLSRSLKGRILLGGVDYKGLSVFQIKSYIEIINGGHPLERSIRDNLILGRTNISTAEINEVLEIVELSDIISLFPDGLDTKLTPSGYPLWSSQIIRLEIARAILQKPKILVISDVFDNIGEERRKKILNFLCKSEMTVILLGHKSTADVKFDKYFLLTRDSSIECSSEKELNDTGKSYES